MPSLIVVLNHHLTSHHALAGKTVEIGRSPSCDVQIAHDSVSRRHARVQYHKAAHAYSVHDLESSNGTRVNGEPADGNKPLRDGDEITMGTVSLRYTDEDFGSVEEAFEHALLEKWLGEDDRGTIVN